VPPAPAVGQSGRADCARSDAAQAGGVSRLHRGGRGMINMPSASARIYVYALGLTIAFCAGAWVGYGLQSM